MSRLTYKTDNGEYTGMPNSIEIRTALEKLSKLEDVEEKLGIDLIPLLTALTNGYVFWKDDNSIYKIQIDSITNCCLKVNTWYYVDSSTIVKRYGDEFTIDFKDYGKTWALTKEELENGK